MMNGAIFIVPILASEHWVVPLPTVVLELITPGLFWYEGMPQYWLDPPPAAPVAAHQKKPPLLSLAGMGAALPHRFCTFHTASPTRGYLGRGLVPGLKFSNEVPPTLVTQG